MNFWKILLVVCAWLLCVAAWQTATAAKISPEALEFDARLDEPVILTLDVDLEGNSSSKVDINVDGFFCDRRVHNEGEGRFRIEIAPETLMAGPVRGKIQVLVDGQALGDPVSISGQVRPWINIRPARIFLGSIGHGEQFETPKTWKISLVSDTEPFEITSVELPEIEGASWACEPEQGIPSQKKTLALTFSPDALAAGFPYGALAKKFVVVETSHPEASILPIPITGMNSVNTTGRDYSTFLYKGELRWQGPWPTPNIAAAFLSMATLLLCGIGAALHRKLGDFAKTRKGKQPLSTSFPVVEAARWSLTALAFLGMAVGCFFLAQTYSRGGWVAMAAGIAVMLVGSRGVRIYPVVLACLFAGAIAINPAGISRAASTGAVEEDKSISNRLLLWEGALQMMAEHPWKGVGESKFGEVFMQDYQRPTHTQNYSTAINDFLTLGTERGIVVLSLVSAIFIGLVVAGFTMGLKSCNPFFTGCAATIVCGLIVSWFSSVAFQSASSRLLIVSALGIVIGVVWCRYCGSKISLYKQEVIGKRFESVSLDLFRLALRSVAAWMFLSVLVAGTLLFAGYVALRSRPVVIPLNIAGFTGVEVTPRSGTHKGTLFYFGDRGETPYDLLKCTLRPLAKKGWSVVCFEQPQFTSDARAAMSEVVKEFCTTRLQGDRWSLAGHRRGALFALAIGTNGSSSAISCYMTPGSSPLAELSPFSLVQNVTCPLLLCAQQADLGRSELRLKKIAPLASTRSLQQQTHSGEFSDESENWQLWIDATSKLLADVDAKSPFQESRSQRK